MPDTTILPTGGMQSNGGGTNWLLIGGAGVGILAVLYLMTKSGGAGQPTTAAGTSINAALGSIQEQNLNLMGQIGQAQGELGSQIGGVSDQLTQTQSDLTSTINAGNAGVVSAVQSGNAGVIGAVQAGNAASKQQGQTWFDALNAALSNYYNSLFGSVQNVSGQVSGVSTGLGGVSTEITNNQNSLLAELDHILASLAGSPAPAPSGGGGGGTPTRTFAVNLPGGGQIWTNSKTREGALNNVPGGFF